MKIDFYGSFQVITLVTGEKWKENCYLLADLETKEAVLVDPGYDSEAIIDLVQKERYTLRDILITHAHHDHIAGVKKISDYFTIPCTVAVEDKRVLMHSPMYSIRFAQRKMDRPQNIQWINEKILDNFVNRGLYILPTPGHSQGGICIFFRQIIFTGDTLIKNYIGRTDLPEGNREQIIGSINKLIEQGNKRGSAILYPGHGEKWTLQEAQHWWNHQNGEQLQELNTF